MRKNSLSPKEIEVLSQHILDGKSNVDIANQFKVSSATVNNHRTRLKREGAAVPVGKRGRKPGSTAGDATTKRTPKASKSSAKRGPKAGVKAVSKTAQKAGKTVPKAAIRAEKAALRLAARVALKAEKAAARAAVKATKLGSKGAVSGSAERVKTSVKMEQYVFNINGVSVTVSGKAKKVHIGTSSMNVEF